MKFYSYLILYLTDAFAGSRSVVASYHLLKGKKTSQTIQDGKLFRISFLFGTFKTIEKEKLHVAIHDLLQDGLLIEIEKSTYILTEKGERILETLASEYRFPKFLNGWVLGDRSKEFWHRFSLFFQTISHLLDGNRKFVPVHNDLQTVQWVKKHFPKSIEERQNVANQLYSELSKIMEQLDETEAVLFSMRLSGNHRVGYTNEQIAQFLHIDEDYVSIIFQGVLHFLLDTIYHQIDTYPLLRLFTKDLYQEKSLTESSGKTYQLLKQGYTIDEIANRRQLKRNTIEDHIVEIAVNDPLFPLDPYVSQENYDQILTAAKTTDSKRLKDIKQYLGDQIDYFQIRLVLMTSGGKNGS